MATNPAMVALEVFGLLFGGILGIVDILLPAGDPRTDLLAQGHSLLRIGIGLNNSSSESLGGTVPSIQVFNEERVKIGQAAGSSSNTVGEGAFSTVPVFHASNHTFQQPTYVEVAGGSDAVCIAYIAQTWADGTQLGWLGDIGKLCGAQWYYSNLYVNTKNGTMVKPYCTWIGGQRNPTCSSGNGTQDCQNQQQNPTFTYSGFKIHTPDFGPVGTRNDFSVPDNPTELCQYPKLEWYKTSNFQTSPAPSLRPFTAVKTLLSSVLGMFTLATGVASAAVTRMPTWNASQEAHVTPRSKIIGSYDPRHSSEALCASPTSWGPDFVSFEEGLFCDMTSKTTWPLCNEDISRGCYDWSTHSVIVGGWARKRKVTYVEVVEWR